MRIRRGNTVANAIKVLGDVIDRAQEPRNALGGLSSTGMTTLVNRPDYAQARDQYLNWVNLAQAMLGSVFADTDLSSGLMSRAYWHICNFDGDVRVLSRLIFEELVYQTGHPGVTDDPTHSQFREATKRLRNLASLADRAGTICVPDTNVLMHYTRFDQFDWRARLKVPQVRLIIPVAVVSEIDNKKYARRAEFWDRARDLLGLIDSYAESSPDGFAVVREGVTVEIFADEEGHVRLPDTDQEILDRCELLRQIADRPVTLVTGDSGARINARVSGVEVLKLARDDLLPRYRPELAEAAKSTDA